MERMSVEAEESSIGVRSEVESSSAHEGSPLRIDAPRRRENGGTGDSRSRTASNDSSDFDSDGRDSRGRGRRARGRARGISHVRSRSRDDIRSSLSPRWERNREDGRIEPSPRRRESWGSPRAGEELDPSKVLHVRNVGYPVTQADLTSLLSCFGPVEKIKMFNGQALVQLPSVSISKATMRHFEKDQEARIGNKRIYINFSRSPSIDARESEGNGNSMDNGRNASRAAGGGSGELNMHEAASPYAHLIMEDHAKLLGLAAFYLQSYGMPAGEGAILNINQREEVADYHRQAMAAAISLNGSGNNHGLAAWSGAGPVTSATAGRLAGTAPTAYGGYGGSRTERRSQPWDRPSQERGGTGRGGTHR